MNKAEIFARLSERYAQIAASPDCKAIERTLGALDSPYSYYVVLSDDERAQVRCEWLALAAQLGFAPKKPKPHKPRSAPALPPRVLAFFGNDECLPHRPRAADDYTLGTQRCSWLQAQGLRSIELNPPAHICWLVFDCDHTDHNRWQNAGLPQPSFITINPDNGHHHVAYRLSAPVCRSENARRHPLEYLHAVEKAMRQALGGDPNYSRVLTKNPLHPAWVTIRLQPMPAYSLAQLAATVDLKKPDDTPDAPKGRRSHQFAERLSTTASGWRNRALFDAVRQRPVIEKDIKSYAAGCNALFPQPLPASEVISIAKSIERYETRRIRSKSASDAFRSRQAARGRLGGRPQTTARSQPWLAAGVSRATWYRQQRAFPPAADRQDPHPGAPCPGRAATIQDSRPWEALGLSRATWYRRRLQDGLVNGETK